MGSTTVFGTVCCRFESCPACEPSTSVDTPLWTLCSGGVAGLVPAAADPWMVFRPVLRPYEADAYRPGIGGRVDRRPPGV